MAKQTMVCPFCGIVFSNTHIKEQNIDRPSNIKELKKIMLNKKKIGHKRVGTVWLHLHDILQMAKLQWQKADQWNGPSVSRGSDCKRDMRKLFKTKKLHMTAYNFQNSSNI